MPDAYLTIGFSFIVALGASLAACFLISGALYRRCTKLEWAVGDLQQRASSFRGKELADKRWKKNEAFELEMAEALKGAPTPKRRYDNDPLGD